MLSREQIQALIPHQGAMCLWDEVLDWTAQRVRLRADNHRDRAHPLRARDRLHAVHLCEYGAQAMAVHGGLRAQAEDGIARPGLLVALRGVQLHVARIDVLPEPLHCEATVLNDSDSGWQYAFHITSADVVLAEGRAAVLLQT